MCLVLPMARNVQTWSVLRRLNTNLYPELELIHGLPQLLESAEFSMQDVYWINTQATNFVVHYKKNKDRWDSVEIKRKICALVELIPSELRDELSRYRELAQ